MQERVCASCTIHIAAVCACTGLHSRPNPFDGTPIRGKLQNTGLKTPGMAREADPQGWKVRQSSGALRLARHGTKTRPHSSGRALEREVSGTNKDKTS